MSLHRKVFDLIHNHLRLIKDFGLNILASFLITAVTQLIVYPWLARNYDSTTYGIILTIMGVGNVLLNTIGNSLNNARLILNSDYEEKGLQGDYPILLMVFNTLSVFVFFVYICCSDSKFIPLTILLLLLYVVLGNIRVYGVVVYRIKLSFLKNLICSSAVAFGNIVGIAFIIITGYAYLWPLIFVSGELLGIIVLFITSDILKEPIKCTSLLKKTTGKYVVLLFTSLVANLLIYLDRLLLLPILGGDSVSTYTTASFFGKSLGIVMTPIAGVLLGYYSQNSFSMGKSLFRKINFIMIGFATGFFLVSLFLAKWFTGLLYPTLIEEAAPYLVLANLALIIGAVANMTQPAILKFAPINWQIVIQIVYFIAYFVGGFFGAKHNGIWGFSIAALVASAARLILLYIIGEYYFNEG